MFFILILAEDILREEDENEFFTKMEKSNNKILNSMRYKSKQNRALLKKKMNDNGVDEIIISHLSTKRKDFSIERFEKIFQLFDKTIIDYRNTNS